MNKKTRNTLIAVLAVVVLALVIWLIAGGGKKAETPVATEAPVAATEAPAEEAKEAVEEKAEEAKGTVEEKIEEVTEKIFGYLKDHPDESFDIHRFTSYYLPTTVKLLETYQNLNSKNVSAQNVTSTMKKIDDMLDKVIAAFENQLNGLYAYQAMDVSAEINVMQDILKTEGLLTEDAIDTVKAGVTEASAVRDFEKDAPSDGITLSLNEKK